MTNDQYYAMQIQQNQEKLKAIDAQSAMDKANGIQIINEPNSNSWTDTIGNVLSTAAGALNNTYEGYINSQIAAAGMANSASAEAQKAQYNYNKELMNYQNLVQEEYLKRMQDFNVESAKQANAFTEKMWNKAAEYNTNIFNAQNAFNEKMWQKSADYNATQAALQRTWQEEMSKTAYQRAVSDMKAAGINPILAAQNGGANIGSGATASIGNSSSGSANMGAASGSQAAGVSANAASGSVGNYSGQGYHLSDTMAIMGGVLGTLGQAISAFQASKDTSGIKAIINSAEDAYREVEKKIEYYREKQKSNTFVNSHFPGLTDSSYYKYYKYSNNIPVSRV